MNHPLVHLLSVTLTLVFSAVANASTLDNNIALSSLGAEAFDNGHWVEQSFPNRGWEYKGSLTIDDDEATWYAGRGSLPQQQLWVVFDQAYEIDAVFLDELDICYSNEGALEYRRDGAWLPLETFSKGVPDYLITFPPRRADAVRLTVASASVPPGWINQNAECLYAFEVGGVPVGGTPCAGDCDGDGSVAVNELVLGVAISLGNAALEQCLGFDRDGDGYVAVNELVAGVANAVCGCGGCSTPPLATPTRTATPTPPPPAATATATVALPTAEIEEACEQNCRLARSCDPEEFDIQEGSVEECAEFCVADFGDDTAACVEGTLGYFRCVNRVRRCGLPRACDGAFEAAANSCPDLDFQAPSSVFY